MRKYASKLNTTKFILRIGTLFLVLYLTGRQADGRVENGKWNVFHSTGTTGSTVTSTY